PIPDTRVINGTLVAYVIFTIAGTVLLLERGQSVGASFFNAASAFGNSGLYVGSLPGAADWRMHVVLLPLAILGGVGVPVLIDLYDAALGRRAISMHTRVVLALTAVAY